jgi:drug/metabolite transporter (DMT)-like permease
VARKAPGETTTRGVPLPAVWLMIASAASLASSGFFAKMAMRSASTFTAVFTRFAIPAVLTLGVLALARRLRELHWRGLLDNIPRGLALCLAQYFLYVAMVNMPLALATILYNSGPIFITLYSIMRKRRVDGRQLGSLALGAVGVCVMLHVERAQLSSYAIAGILAGLFQAVSQIALHRATRRGDSPTVVMLWTYVVGLGACLLVLATGQAGLRFMPSATSWWLISLWLLLAAAGSMGNQQFRGQAYALVEDAASLSPIIYATVPISAAFDIVFYHLIPDLQEAAGGSLVIVAALLSMGKGRR